MSGSVHSVQLYTLRTAIAADLSGTLSRIAAMGYRNVELYRHVQYRDDYRAALAAMGLSPLSAHADLLGGDAQAAVDAAIDLGVGTLIEPRIDAARWTTRSDIEDAAKELNAVGERARGTGLTIGYHNHDHELRHDFGGRTGLELFADALAGDVVIELDIYWAEVAGASAAELISRLGDRVTFLHLKDGLHNGNLLDQQPVGQGEMPVRDILKAAPDAVRVVELDDYAGDMFEAVEQSLRHLKEIDR